MTHESKYDYIKQKIAIDGQCNCIPPEMCGICWWKAVTLPPEKVPECVLCVEDTQNARAEIIANKKHKTVIELKCNCCNSCIWWDWFHQKRELYAVQNGVKFKYTKKCTERVP